MSIKDAIDYDFTNIPDDQSTGLIEQPPAELLASFADLPWFDELCASDMVPRSEWRARGNATKAAFRASVAEIYSQGRTSACVGFSVGQGVEGTLTRRYGLKHRVPLSGMSIYDQIGRTLMSGAYIPDGVKCASDVGPLPLRTAETQAKYAVTFPGLEYKWKRPAGWENVSRLFRITKAAKVQGAEMHVSAALKGRWIIVGRQRHAIPYGYYDPEKGMAYANSWSSSFGDAGWGYDSERTFANLVGYVILEVAFRPDIDLPPLT